MRGAIAYVAVCNSGPLKRGRAERKSMGECLVGKRGCGGKHLKREGSRCEKLEMLKVGLQLATSRPS
jgi:hypothetical protein